MNTIFKQLYRLTSLLLLLSFVLIGFGVRFEFRNYLMKENREALNRNAESIAQLASSYSGFEELENSWTFRVALTFSERSGSIVSSICYPDGAVCLNSSACSDSLSSIPGSIPPAFLSEAANDGFFEYGTLDGLIEENCFISILPFHFTNDSGISGYVISLLSTAQYRAQLDKTTLIFLLIVILILAISIAVTSFAANKNVKPIRALSEAANRFGHGDMNARYEIQPDDTEEIRNLALSFNNMADSIGKSELRRKEFVANVSHELKTPMTTISGFIDGMLDGTIPEQKHRQYMFTVSNEIRRLSRLVSSMLEISRLQDAGIDESKKKRFDICEAMSRTLLTFEQRINARHLNVDIQMPENGLAVKANEDTIIQVLYNLTDNAIKFSDDYGTIYLQIESNGQKAVVSIANTGNTIPSDELALIFDRFHKIDKSRSRDTEGAGLGLYIVKTIIEAHGEDISVRSRDGITRFAFTLPVG